MPLFNKFSPLADPALRGARRGAARALRLPLARPVRDGRLEALDATATPSSPASAPRSASCCSTRWSTRLQPAEVEAVLAHELGHFKLHHIVKGMAISWALQLRAAVRCSACSSARPWFYSGLGVHDAPRCRSRCCSSCWWCPCSPSSCSRSPACSRASTNSRPTRYAAQHADARRPGARAGQALPRQRRDPHARSAALARSTTRIRRRRCASPDLRDAHERAGAEEVQALRRRRRALHRGAGEGAAEGAEGLGRSRTASSSRPTRSRTTTRPWPS